MTVQAFALTVIDFDHDTITALQEELQARGLAASVATVAQDEATGTPSTQVAAAVAAGATGAAAAPSSDSSAGESEEAAFKCPACGATYPVQVECTNQHEPVATLPTEDVLAGAAPDGAPAADEPAATTEGPAQETSGEAAASGGAVGGAAAAPADPSEPGTDWPQ